MTFEQLLNQLIEGYDYNICENGEVVNIKTGRIKKTYINNFGYRCVKLYKNNRQKGFSIHRLVAQAFIPNPEKLTQVNHKDSNRLNNCIDNLERVTPSQNIIHGYTMGHIKSNLIGNNGKAGKFGKNNATSKKVYQYTKDKKNLLSVWGSVSDIKRELGWNIGNIASVCRGNTEQKSANGYYRSYILLSNGLIKGS